MSLQKEDLLSRIEVLRSRLNKEIDTKKNIPKNCSSTYALSTELDELINLYMRSFQKT